MSKYKIGCVVAIAIAATCGIRYLDTFTNKPETLTICNAASHVAYIEPIVEVKPKVSVTATYSVALSTELQHYTYGVCKSYLVDTYYPLMLAVMWKESGFNPSRISKTNDYGVMQINKVNHAWLSDSLGVTNFLDAEQNIKAGVYMLSKYLLKYNDIEKALMAYNMGEGGATRCWKKGIYNTTYTRAVLAKLTLVQNTKK